MMDCILCHLLLTMSSKSRKAKKSQKGRRRTQDSWIPRALLDGEVADSLRAFNDLSHALASIRFPAIQSTSNMTATRPRAVLQKLLRIL